MTRTSRRAVALALVLGATALVGAAEDETEDEAPLAYSDKGADSCLACHEEASTLALFKSRHGVPSDPHGPFGPGQLQCEACHGPSGAHAGRVRRGQERPAVYAFGDESSGNNARDDQMCLGCHAEDAAWHGGTHQANDVGCADCHTVHLPRDPVLRIASQNEVCTDCHVAQRTEVSKHFAHPLQDGQMACSDCHNAHAAGEQSLARPTVNETCYTCHAEKRGPFVWEHAPVAEDCGTCHEPHGSNQPGMLAQRAPLLCQSCHSQSGHPSIAYTADGLPPQGTSPYLLGESCMNCHSRVHGSNHPSGSKLMR